jgi:hypothetical protein
MNTPSTRSRFNLPAQRLAERAGRAVGLRKRLKSRRGVAAVLAMMFLILFGSLSAAMAIASKGNITTAATHLHVSRAMSAAETGLAVAESRLREASNQFLVSKSAVNTDFGWSFWTGSLGDLGTNQIVPSKTGRQDVTMPGGMAAALAAMHALDTGIVSGVSVNVPTIGARMASVTVPADYKATDWVYTPAVAIEAATSGSTIRPLCYSITYAPLADASKVRVIVTGYDYAYSRNGQPIARTLIQDFQLNKRVKQAVISPTRIMIGKNVMVSGGLGARFTDVNYTNGDPVILKSDFSNVVPKSKMQAFYDALVTYDLDNDGRLKTTPGNPEAAGITSAADAYFAGGPRDDTFTDASKDGFFDEFDLYMNEVDANKDGKITPTEAASDLDLFNLIDSSNPDRNKNSVWGFRDLNANGVLDSGEVFNDVDPVTGTNRDQVLGYLDNVVDNKDQYAKVNGKLSFKVTQSDWTTARGLIAAKLRGGIKPAKGQAAQQYGMTDAQLPDINAATFSTSRTKLQTLADGANFASQVATASKVPGSATTKASTLTADANGDGLPDNFATAYWEKMPFNSPTYTDIYYRPVYENIVFKNVQIPAGTNALFKNCWFIGVTWVRSTTDNTHRLWNEYGKIALDAAGVPAASPPRTIYGPTGTDFPTMVPSAARREDGTVLMATPPLDQADLTASAFAATPGASAILPSPLFVGGKRITDTKAFSNNLRFHDCLFVGSLVSDSPTGYTNTRNKMQFTGSTRFTQSNPSSTDDAHNPDSADMADIKTSSLMVPNYSVDIGSFNSPQTQNVELKGAIIAGVMDVRGNASVDGALLLTFKPTYGAAPLIDVLGNPIGNPAEFNTTIGYFGPDDGDSESLDPEKLPTDSTGNKVVGWDTNGDGIYDIPSTQPKPTGSTAVYFNGYGRVHLRFDPTMSLPDGLMLPLQYDALITTYREGNP